MKIEHADSSPYMINKDTPSPITIYHQRGKGPSSLEEEELQILPYILWRQMQCYSGGSFIQLFIDRMGRKKKQKNAEKQSTGNRSGSQSQIIASNIADQIPSPSPSPSPSPPLELHQRRPSVTKTKKIRHHGVLLSRRYGSLHLQCKTMKIRHQLQFNKQVQSFKANRRVIEEQNTAIVLNKRTISDQKGQIGNNKSLLEWYRNQIKSNDVKCQMLYDEEMLRERRLAYLHQEIAKKQQILVNLTNTVQQNFDYSSEEEEEEEEFRLQTDSKGQYDEYDDDNDDHGGMTVGIGHYPAPNAD